jgi:hypothetical protein
LEIFFLFFCLEMSLLFKSHGHNSPDREHAPARKLSANVNDIYHCCVFS